VDLAQGRITWRAEHEKTGRERTTPMTPRAGAAFDMARKHAPGIGDTPVLPAPKELTQPVDRYLLRNWWLNAEQPAGLARRPGRGWHSLRRKFATELMDQPLKVLCQLGGWKDAETVLNCYQRPDEHTLRAALEDRPRGPRSGPRGPTNRHIRT
jgi:integrase